MYRTPDITVSPRFAALCEIDLALTYSMRRPKLARECAERALAYAIKAGAPRLAWSARDILAAL